MLDNQSIQENYIKYCNMENYVGTHVHSYYSLMDGESSPKKLAHRAKELGMTSLAITDHNHLLGVYDFQHACEDEGIKPLLGVEMYYTKDITICAASNEEHKILADELALKAGIDISKIKKGKDKTAARKPFMYDTHGYHVLFIAKNRKGYLNLVKLQSEAARLCTQIVYKQPHFHCDDDLIDLYKEGLIMTTACVGSWPAHLIQEDRYIEAEQVLIKWHEMFKDDFYLEIQPQCAKEQYKVNNFYINMHKKHGFKLVASNDVHYALEADSDDHDSVLCLNGHLKSDPTRLHYSHEFWLRSLDEMKTRFIEQYKMFATTQTLEDYNEYYYFCLEALYNTNEIAEKVEDHILLGSEESLLPTYNTGNALTPEEDLIVKCYQNLFNYKKNHPEIDLNVYLDRLAYELDVINPKGFASYMLINWENIHWCEEHSIPTGPGRGSAAGSLVLFLLNVTKIIDPIKNGLLFFRFLTVDRTSLPDLEIA